MRSIYSLDMLSKGMIHIQGGTEEECVRLHHTTQNGMQFKTFELFISKISHLVFSDSACPWGTETAASESTDQGHWLRHYLHFPTQLNL